MGCQAKPIRRSSKMAMWRAHPPVPGGHRVGDGRPAHRTLAVRNRRRARVGARRQGMANGAVHAGGREGNVYALDAGTAPSAGGAPLARRVVVACGGGRRGWCTSAAGTARGLRTALTRDHRQERRAAGDRQGAALTHDLADGDRPARGPSRSRTGQQDSTITTTPRRSNVKSAAPPTVPTTASTPAAEPHCAPTRARRALLRTSASDRRTHAHAHRSLAPPS